MKVRIIISICFFFFVCNLFAQREEIDSLLRIIKTEKADTNKLEDLNELSWGYNHLGSSDSCILFGTMVLELCDAILKETKNEKVKQNTIHNKGFAYNNIGNAYENKGNYPEAIKSAFASLQIGEQIGFKKGVAASYANIGSIYVHQANYTDALKYDLIALKLYEGLGSKGGVAYSYNNIGLIYEHKGRISKLGSTEQKALFDTALNNIEASLKIEKEIDDQQGVSNSYDNIGNVYGSEGNYEKALENHLASLKMREELNDRRGMAGSYCNAASDYFKRKKYKETETYLFKGENLAKEIGYKEGLMSIYGALAELDSAKGDFKEAFKNSKLYIVYRDSIDNEETRKKTIQSQMTYDFEKKEAVATAEHKKELENQQVLADEKGRKQRVVLLLVVSCLLLVGVFALLILRTLRTTRKQKLVIEHQKDLVEEKQKEILDSIYYASRIQKSLLPTERYIQKHFDKRITNKQNE